MINRRVAIVWCVLACGKSSTPQGSAETSSTTPSPSIIAAEPSLSSSTSAANSKGKCPPTGLWALCSVEHRLTRAGFVVRRLDQPTLSRPGFSVPPTAYRLGHSHLEVFVYPTEGALKRDLTGLDTVTASPPGKPTAWEGTPTFVHAANLAAVFLTDSRENAERLALTLTAGAPQPAQAPVVIKPIVTQSTRSGQDQAPLPE